jgi:hypothetical protein
VWSLRGLGAWGRYTLTPAHVAHVLCAVLWFSLFLLFCCLVFVAFCVSFVSSQGCGSPVMRLRPSPVWACWLTHCGLSLWFVTVVRLRLRVAPRPRGFAKPSGGFGLPLSFCLFLFCFRLFGCCVFSAVALALSRLFLLQCWAGALPDYSQTHQALPVLPAGSLVPVFFGEACRGPLVLSVVCQVLSLVGVCVLLFCFRSFLFQARSVGASFVFSLLV